MSKNILTESTKSKFKVLDKKPANVLKRIQGVLSDFKSNRNGRKYPRELWQNVLNSDYVKEMIESHGLVGELDHPETRLEISLQNVSHVINDMWIEGDQVLGTIDILPTPSGKIVSELLDYGTDIGISSRGAGTVLADDSVDPSDYQFVTFDFVARPSCEAARLNMIVEGVQTEIDNNSDDKVKSIIEGYKTSLKEDTSDAKSIVKSMLEKDGEVLIDRGMAKVVVVQINEENFNDMPDMLIKQLKREHKLNYWYCIFASTKENKPYSYEQLPIFGDATKYVTKWLSRTKEDAIKHLLDDKEKDVVDRVILDKHYLKQIKSIQKSLSHDDFYALSFVLDNLWNYDIDAETCKLSEIKQIVKQASREYKEYGHDWEFNVDKVYNAIIKLYNRDTNEGYKTCLKENDFETYTDYSGDKPVKKQRHTNDYCTVAAAEFTLDRLPANWRELPDDELEDLVREEVNTYNYANVEPEYEKEDIYGDEANAREVYQYILDNKKSKETRVNESDENKEDYFETQLSKLYDEILTLAKEAEQSQRKDLSKKLDNMLDILDMYNTNESVNDYQKRIMNNLVESLINK